MSSSKKEEGIDRTYIPFVPRIRVNEEDIAEELFSNICKFADTYGKECRDFSGKFELLPDPMGNGHYLLSEITYLKGKLTH